MKKKTILLLVFLLAMAVVPAWAQNAERIPCTNCDGLGDRPCGQEGLQVPHGRKCIFCEVTSLGYWGHHYRITCYMCGGSGEIQADLCTDCLGSGRTMCGGFLPMVGDDRTCAACGTVADSAYRGITCAASVECPPCEGSGRVEPTPTPSPTPVPTDTAEPTPVDTEAPAIATPAPVSIEIPEGAILIEIVIDSPAAKVNGAEVVLEQSATLLNERTVVPLRFIAESLGASVAWNADTQTAVITKGSIRIEVTLDDPIARVNGQSVTLEQSATLLNERTVVPARFIAESLGAQVAWDGAAQRITIIGDTAPPDFSQIVL